MTTRHLLDRAILRACDFDTRLSGVWDPLSCLTGHERDIAYEVVSLGAGGDVESLARQFQRCRTLDDLMSTVDNAANRPASSSDDGSGSLFGD